MNLPFSATTETGIKIYRLSEYNNMNEQTKAFMSYLNTMLLDKRLTGLYVEYHSQANVFYINNNEMPNYSFTVHCTQDENRYIVAPRNISPDTYRYTLNQLKQYVESFFYTYTSHDVADV